MTNQFKQTARAYRLQLIAAGHDPIYIYNALRSYKLSPPVVNP